MDAEDTYQGTTTEAIDGKDAGNSHDDVDDVGRDGDQERVADARTFKECCAVVEDEATNEYRKMRCSQQLSHYT